MQGKTIIGFELKRLLGKGGMAEVWYAENKIHKPAAVKILNEDLSQNESITDRFRNEAEVMVKLNHPNIRQVYDYGEIDGRPAIVMEYLDGDDLKARLKNGQRFTDEELKKWWNQLVDALNYTHQRGIVHRDIKPGNIFVDTDGNIKLLDFGIAKVRESISATQTGQKLGTLMYMSPEQVKDSKHTDNRTDIYSLAVTFVHLLTGKKPYDSDTSSDFEISEQIVYRPLDISDVPAEWKNFLAPYLEKEPIRRPPLRHFETAAPVRPAANYGVNDGSETMVASGSPDYAPPTGSWNVVGQTPPPVDRLHGTPSPESRPQSPNPNKTNTTNSKKTLWIALGAAAVGLLAAVLLLTRDPFKRINKWIEKSEHIYYTYHFDGTMSDYSDAVSHLNEGYRYNLKAVKKLGDMVKKAGTADWNMLMERAAQMDLLYCQNVDTIIKQELVTLHPNENTGAVVDRLRQLEQFAYFSTEDVPSPDAYTTGPWVCLDLGRIEKEIEWRRNEYVYTANGISFVMKPISGGTFRMGSNDSEGDGDERPIHNVKINSFYMGETEVTQALWKAVMGENPSYFEGDSLPVEQVSWDDCQDFIDRLNRLTGMNFRLPTEAEWEYAARAGTNTMLYNGQNIDFYGDNNAPNLGLLAWYGGNCGQDYTVADGCDVDNGWDISDWDEKQYEDEIGGTHPVARKQPNAYGLYDVLGNVWEWCSDWYSYSYYSDYPSDNPTGPYDGSSRIRRGGSWSATAKACRVSYRQLSSPDNRSYSIGFRLAFPE